MAPVNLPAFLESADPTARIVQYGQEFNATWGTPVHFEHHGKRGIQPGDTIFLIYPLIIGIILAIAYWISRSSRSNPTSTTVEEAEPLRPGYQHKYNDPRPDNQPKYNDPRITRQFTPTAANPIIMETDNMDEEQIARARRGGCYYATMRVKKPAPGAAADDEESDSDDDWVGGYGTMMGVEVRRVVFLTNQVED
ncbi:hypothetical protein GLAREA_08259 [Glarea lozoyensis ATCC 20868]|uniref:Uncharacterized protein n=2 Tax=Glarea lozoyensis TaxID=101852 RepID=S3CCZ5_GLAL2|nr:uncharacterized protein GLAREA_08259 [Glarea lozoyensis ATCC 20868]EHL01547.1 hypothetical protein M7I_2431 [Glarea lozoyensis 74030]EPE24407.1 hypothetical protein GLAREA_08259 [Glarea lozoyensis ATCC 20868]